MTISAIKYNQGWQPAGFVIAALGLGLLLAVGPLWWTLGIIGAAALFLLSLIFPLLSVGLMLLAGPFAALERIALGNLPLNSGQILFLFVVALWLGRGVMKRQIILPYTPLNLPLFIFMGAAALSLFSAVSPAAGLNELFKWVGILLLMWLVVDWAGGKPSRKSILTILALLLLAGLLQALIGVWQFGLRGHGPEHFIILGQFYRAYGTFEQPNPFGGYMGLNASLALGAALGLASWGAAGLIAYFRGDKTSRLWHNYPLDLTWLTFPLLICLTALAASLSLFLSWSRGAWLGFAAALASLIFFWPRRRWPGFLLLALAAGVFLLLLATGFLPASIVERLSSLGQDFHLGDVRGVPIHDANYAVLERLAQWQSALAMARDHIWLGVGFGNYNIVYAQYALLNWPYALGHAHNYYLNLLAEVGVIGLSAYLFLWAMIFWQTGRILQDSRWPERGVALGLLASWVHLTVHHLVDNLYVNNIYLHLGIMLGLLQLLYRMED